MTLSRPPVTLDERRCFTPLQKARMFERAGGRCEVVIDEHGVPVPARVIAPSTAIRCNRKIRGKWIAGHFPISWTLGGPTDINNGRVECPQCAKHTQADDTTTAAKCERISGRKGQFARRKRRGPTLKSRKTNWPKTKIPARPFPKKKRDERNGK